jgi:serine/threonine protein kinase
MLNSQASQPIVGKLLNRRYYVIEILSFGVLGRTYLAQDISQMGSPKCVIKHLKLTTKEPDSLETAKQLFLNEAQILENLGQHEQIPQILGGFEDKQGFYIVQEFIEGQPLSELMPTSTRCGKRWSENQVVQMLQEILGILEFIHSEDIIHCNINPNSIIKRASDGKLCLIDFSAIQPIQTLLLNIQESFNGSINLSPAGYIPAEQLANQPRPNSDIYALGTIGIQALTGLHPAQLQISVGSSENFLIVPTTLINQSYFPQEATVSEEFANILNKMVRPHYKDRYQTVREVLRSLQQLPAKTQASKITLEESFKSRFEPESHNRERQITNLNSPPLLQHASSLSLPSSFDFDLSISLFPLLPLPPMELQPNQAISIPSLPPLLIVFSAYLAGIATNYMLIEAGIHDIVQPDPANFKLAEKPLNEKQLLTISEKLCQIPHICFWQDQPLNEAEVKELLQKAYRKAEKRDFAGALIHLEEITPRSPRYAYIQKKIAEYRKKNAVRMRLK